MTPKEEREILTSHPKGTLALLLIYAGLMLAGWLLLYFGRYLALGPAS